MGKAGEVVSDSICQARLLVALISVARGPHSNVEPLLGAQPRTATNSGAQGWGEKATSPSGRQETVNKPNVLWRY